MSSRSTWTCALNGAGILITEAVARAVITEALRREYSHPETLAVLTLAIDENWPDTLATTAWLIDVFDQLDAYRARGRSSIDPWKNVFDVRTGTPRDIPAFHSWRARLFAHVRTADALYKRLADGKDDSLSYGLPTGTRITYGSPGFPDWVYELAEQFGLKASTYPGHQETNRAEAGFAPNPNHLNRGIDWGGSVVNMQRFAEYCLSIRGSLEQVIWQNPGTGQKIGVAGGSDVSRTGYYDYDGGYNKHRNHVHTRQSRPIPLPDNWTPVWNELMGVS